MVGDTTQYRKSFRRFNTPGDAHFLTFSCYDRLPLLSSERSRMWLAESLARACRRHEIALWAYVFMPEHVHLLVKPRGDLYDIGAFLAGVKQPVTRQALLHWHRGAHDEPCWDRCYHVRPGGAAHFRFWLPGGGYDRNIQSREELTEKLNYIHANPVRRGLADVPESWRWSSASAYLGREAGPVPVEIADVL